MAKTSFQSVPSPRKLSTLLKALVGFLLLIGVGAGYFYLRGRDTAQDANPQQLALNQLQQVSDREPILHFNNGFPGFAQVNISVEGADPAERARNFLKIYQDLYLQNHPDLTLEVKRADDDAVVFYQTYKGLQVYGAEIVVTLEGDKILATVGNLLTSNVERQQLNMTPGITDQEAAEFARAELGLPDADMLGNSQLVIFDPSLLGQDPANVHLAWQLTLNAAETVQVLVDALTGKTLFVRPFSLEDLDLDMQDAENQANAEGYLCYLTSDELAVADEDGVNPEYSDDIDAVKAHNYITRAYGFYRDTFGHLSYDGKDSQLEVFIHAIVKSASWSDGCDLIQFKTGRVDFEVMVHEMTHGVIQETSGLIYISQMGALNESYADVMGVIADRQGGDNNWTFAENRTDGSAPTRNISNPAHMDDFVILPSDADPDNDHGGVHTNSAIPNFAAYLIANGGQLVRGSTEYIIKGIGEDKTLQLYYFVMTNLPRISTFRLASSYTIVAAEKWAASSTNGFTANDVCQVRNAFAAVGLQVVLDLDCDGILDANDNDRDSDGIPDFEDNCPNLANPWQQNINSNGIGDACEPDLDKDGIPDGEGLYGDNCPEDPNYNQKDLNFNGIGDACDPTANGDFDDDGIPDNDDNCYLDPNPDQENADAHLDNEGDACDPDADGDGLSYDNDNCVNTANPDQANSDGDLAGDACDQCPSADDVNAWTSGNPELGIEPHPLQPDRDGDGIPNACDDSILAADTPWDLVLVDLEISDSLDVMVHAEPGNVILMPLPGCMPLETGSEAPHLHRNVLLQNLGPNIFAIVVDDEGMGAGKPNFDEELTILSVKNPLGGSEYFLQLYFGEDYVAGESSFRFSFNCSEPEQLEEEAVPAATSTPSENLIAIPSQNANCRLGPSGEFFESVDFLFTETEYVPVAQGPDQAWLLFDGPDYDGNCWVFIDNLDLFCGDARVEIANVSPCSLARLDYPAFPTLTPTPTFTPEPDATDVPVLPECNDGIDNDGDGDIDLADGKCVDANDDAESH